MDIVPPPGPGRVVDRETLHTIKNHLAIVLGYCELLLTEASPDDARRLDLEEMHRAATAVYAIFNEGES
jgi:hypothetical protein